MILVLYHLARLLLSFSLQDEITSKDDTFDFCKKLIDAKKMSISYTEIKSANHFFDNKMEKLSKTVNNYIKSEKKKYARK